MVDIDVRNLAVLLLAVTASIWDVRTRRLPNWLTFGSAAMALSWALLSGGFVHLGWSAAGWTVALLLFFPLFALRGLGAGDVKLMGAFGAWLGPSGAFYLAFYTAMAGGVLAVAVLLWCRGLGRAVRNLWQLLLVWRATGIRPVEGFTLETHRGPRLAYGLAIAVGAVTTLWLR
jgi:prepilin peptidase CpaA